MGHFLRTRNLRVIVTWVTLTLLAPITSKATLYNLGAFWKQPVSSGDSLAFTSSAFSGLTTWTCTGPVTVQSQSGGAPKTVASTTTVNLTGPSGIHFFSDSSCTQEVTSATINSGSSSTSFYFLAGKKKASTTLLASATNYTTATQDQTVTAYLGCTWLGGTVGNATTWETPTNWSCGHMPTTTVGDIAVFDANCGINCTPSSPASSQDLYGLYLTKDYTGNIQQGSSAAVVVEAGGKFRIDGGTFTQSNQNVVSMGPFTQTGGTFAGGSGTITYMDSVNVSGGSFTLSSVSTFANYTWSITGSATVNANGGTLTLQPNSLDGTVLTMNMGASHYKNVNIYPTTTAFDFGGATFYVDGNLSFGDSSSGASTMSKTKTFFFGGAIDGTVTDPTFQISTSALNNVTFSVGGNVESVNNGATGTAQFIFRGANPTLSVVAATLSFPNGNVTVSVSGTLGLLSNAYLDSAGQTVTVTSGAINMNGHNLQITSLTLAPGTSVTRGSGTLTVGGATVGAGPYSGGTIY